HLHGGVDLFALGAEVDDGQVAVDGLNDAAQRREKSGRLHAGTHLVNQRSDIWLLNIGKKELRGRIIPQIGVLCVGADADDLDPIRGVAICPETLSDRIGIRKSLATKRMVDDSNL